MSEVSQHKPPFLITVDTEGDNLWGRPIAITTRNAAFLPRFQGLCDLYGFKPTYLTNYEMAVDQGYVAWVSKQIDAGRAEVGMHLHAWNSPPDFSLTDNDDHYQPYLIEYPDAILQDKVGFMTKLLEETFGAKPRSHRAGRFGFNEVYAKALARHGYWVDCTVAPGMSFKGIKGAPNGAGGPDFSAFPTAPYFLDLNDIRHSGDSRLVELPLTLSVRLPWLTGLSGGPSWIRNGVRKLQGLSWIRPNGKNLSQMLDLVRMSSEHGTPYIQFIIHSSELMPGGSPTFPDECSIEKLYSDLDGLFSTIAEHFRGETLSGYYQSFVNCRETATA